MPTVKPIQLDRDAPWKRRYLLPITYGVSVAGSNSERGLAVSDRTGVDQLYAWHVPSSGLVQLTTKAEGVGLNGDGMVNGVLSPDGLYIYYLDGQLGDETGHFVRVSYAGDTPPEDITPDLPLYAGFVLGFSEDGNHLGFTALVDGQYRQYTLDVGIGRALSAPRLLYASERQTIGPLLSYDGTVAVVQTKRPNTGIYDLVALDVATGDEIARLTDEVGGSLEVYLAGRGGGVQHWLATSSHTGSERPFFWNPLTGARSNLHIDGIEGDVIPMDWSADGTHILLRQGIGVVQRLHQYNVDTASSTPIPHPGGAIGTTEPRSIFYGPDGDLYARWESSAHPPCTIRLEVGHGDHTAREWHVALMGDAAPGGYPWRSVEFPSSDGVPVQAWLGLPDSDGPFPAIIEMHGGPEFAVTDVFSPPSQCWLDHGFAYLTVNYRGSAGFGSAFQEKIQGNLGHWEVEDLVAARNWLVEQGVATVNAIFLTGWSYGGYLTLMGLGKRPDLWAGGMACAALADLAMNDEDGSMIKGYLRGLIGGSPSELPERYAASSPISYADRLAAPVLILQGRNDTRCTPRQVEAYEARAHALGKRVEVKWFDSGHGGVAVDQRIQQQEMLLRFVYEQLGKISK